METTPSARLDLFYSSTTEGAQPGRQLWRAPADGSTPRALLTPVVLNTPRPIDISLSPDGHQLGYTEITLPWNLWILERFLPRVR